MYIPLSLSKYYYIFICRFGGIDRLCFLIWFEKCKWPSKKGIATAFLPQLLGDRLSWNLHIHGKWMNQTESNGTWWYVFGIVWIRLKTWLHHLVGGLVAINFIFPLILGVDYHPNWRTLIFFRGVQPLAHQPVIGDQLGQLDWPWGTLGHLRLSRRMWNSGQLGETWRSEPVAQDSWWIMMYLPLDELWWVTPLVNVCQKLWNITIFFMGKL